MGELWPKYPQDVQDGDEPTHSPTKNQNSLLGAERGTQSTRRLETDSNNNLYVNVAANSLSETLLFSSTLSSIAAATPTAFTAYTAPSAKTIYRVAISGEGAADYTLRLNAGDIGIKRTNLELNVQYDFPKGLPMAFGDTLDAIVDHCSTGHSLDFNIYIYGV